MLQSHCKRISLFLFCLVTFSFVACKKHSSPVDRPEGDSGYVISFNYGVLRELRSHGVDSETPGMTQPNTDTKHSEDKISELRLILFRTGAATSALNQLFTARELAMNKATFKLKDLGAYDFYFIANESASGQGASDLSFLKNAQVTRTQLENVKTVRVVGINPNTQGSGANLSFMMTAVYKDVYLSRSLPGSGRDTDPYIIDFSVANRQQRPQLLGSDRSAAELMRSLAKVELILKDVVAIRTTPSSNTPQYSWILPYGFRENTELLIEFLNMPRTYSLLPSDQLTDASQISPSAIYSFNFSSRPDKNYVIPPTSMEDSSIGGIYTGDYKLYFYLPEALLPSTLDESKRPGVKISYYKSDVPNMQSHYYPIENGTTPTHYDTVLQGLTDHAPWNVYRNRLYQINVNITGKPL